MREFARCRHFPNHLSLSLSLALFSLSATYMLRMSGIFPCHEIFSLYVCVLRLLILLLSPHSPCSQPDASFLHKEEL